MEKINKFNEGIRTIATQIFQKDGGSVTRLKHSKSLKLCNLSRLCSNSKRVTLLSNSPNQHLEMVESV